jgi:hypothetical protein
VTANTVTAYLLQQIQLHAHGDRHGLAPWSTTGNQDPGTSMMFCRIGGVGTKVVQIISCGVNSGSTDPSNLLLSASIGSRTRARAPAMRTATAGSDRVVNSPAGKRFSLWHVPTPSQNTSRGPRGARFTIAPKQSCDAQNGCRDNERPLSKERIYDSKVLQTRDHQEGRSDDNGPGSRSFPGRTE